MFLDKVSRGYQTETLEMFGKILDKDEFRNSPTLQKHLFDQLKNKKDYDPSNGSGGKILEYLKVFNDSI